MMVGTPGKWNPKVARLIWLSLIERLPVTVGSISASNCMRSTRALVEEFSRVSRPGLGFKPGARASSRDRFNGAGVAAPDGVLPLNCANSGKNVVNNVKNALNG